MRMKVMLSDPVVTVTGWTHDLDQIGEYTLRTRKTPEEIKKEKDLFKDKYPTRKPVVRQYRESRKTVIHIDEGEERVATFLPGLWPRVEAELKSRGIAYDVEDKRNKAIRPPLDYSAFEGVKFRGNQDVAAVLISKCDCGIIETSTAYGKCHHGDTPILMYDGSIKLARDIQIGDQLMGDDSTPRNVLNLTRGRGVMYKYTPVRGDSFIFNGNHMLSLVNCANRVCRHNGKRYGQGDVLDISIEEYLTLSKTKKHILKAYRSSGVDFHQEHLQLLDPYFVGVYLGDGTEAFAQLTTPDPEILDYCRTYGESIGWEVKYDNDNGRCATLVFKLPTSTHRRTKAPIVAIREACGITIHEHGRRITDVYKFGTREQRMQLLAGLIDTDGHLVNDAAYEITTKWDALAEDIMFVARSLGFYAYDNYCQKKCCNTGAVGWYHRIDISGEINKIPIKVARKKATDRKHGTDSRHVGFELEELPEDDYYGFGVDGNHRYLLGDFTVTHNSFLISYLCKALPSLNIVVTTSSQQVVATIYDRIRQLIPNEVGVLYAGHNTIEGKRVIVTTLKSLPAIKPEKVHLVFVDECHNVGDSVAARDLMKFCWARKFGFSASPVRNDGSAIVMESLLGPTILKMTYEEAVDANMVTPMLYTMLPCNKAPAPAYNMALPDVMKRKWSYWRNSYRNKMIQRFVLELTQVYKGQVLIMCSSLEHCIALHQLLPWFKVVHSGHENQDDLKKKFPKEKFPNLDLTQYKLTAKQIDITRRAYEKGTLRYAICTKTWRQGVDMVHLACIIRADGDVSEIECIQIPGRAARLDSNKDYAYLVDLNDTFSPWALSRTKGREAQYAEQKWKCVTYKDVINGLCKQAESGDVETAE